MAPASRTARTRADRVKSLAFPGPSLFCAVCERSCGEKIDRLPPPLPIAVVPPEPPDDDVACCWSVGVVILLAGQYKQARGDVRCSVESSRVGTSAGLVCYVASTPNFDCQRKACDGMSTMQERRGCCSLPTPCGLVPSLSLPQVVCLALFSVLVLDGLIFFFRPCLFSGFSKFLFTRNHSPPPKIVSILLRVE